MKKEGEDGDAPAAPAKAATRPKDLSG